MNLGELLQAKLANKTFKNDLLKAEKELELNRLGQLQAEMMMKNKAAQMQMNMYNNMIGSAITTGIGAATQTTKQDIPEFDPNTAPAYQCSLEALADLWRAKHGDKWVRSSRAEINYRLDDSDDIFWDDAEDRLRNAHLLESNRGWLRIKD